MSRQVVVRALKAFDGLNVGDIVWVEMSEQVAHLIVNLYLQILDDPAWRQSDSTDSVSD